MSTIPIAYIVRRSLNINKHHNNYNIKNKKLYGLSLSNEGLSHYNNLLSSNNKICVTEWSGISRHDPLLHETMQKLGDKVSSTNAFNFKISNIPSEYISCYSIHNNDDGENIICDPRYLVADIISNMDINDISNSDCKQTLLHFQNILNNMNN